ncbi:unnamed protein product [Phytomonas sp. Hart1]|nr:unnamed protein product [Phytomonas sp. Hart1]|eukprot:CCW70069.1 unnamed protein product [Phytomonas sp. isolate Hart1]
MEHNDFEFPPDPVHHNFEPFPSLQSIPISVLAQTPVDQLPPTTAPTSGNYSIRQIMRSAMCFEAKSNLGGYRNINLGLGGGENSDRQPYGGPPADPFALGPPSSDGIGGVERERGPQEPPSEVGREGGMQEIWQRASRSRRSRAEWTEGELRNFFHSLSQYGTDFAAISVLFPGRSRADVKLLYRREMRKHPNRVRVALQKKKDIDLATFEMFLKEKRAREQPPKKVLALEEEQLLQQIAQVEPASQDHASGGGVMGDYQNDFFLMETPRDTQHESVTTRPSAASSTINNDAESSHPQLSSSDVDHGAPRSLKRKREVNYGCDEEPTLLEMVLKHPKENETMTLAKEADHERLDMFDFTESPQNEFDDAFLF